MLPLGEWQQQAKQVEEDSGQKLIEAQVVEEKK